MTMGIMPVTGIPLPVHELRRLVAHRHASPASASSPTSPCAASTELIAVELADARRLRESEPALVGCRQMSNLWPRIEPLLARVEKPARYIGMERGSLRPEHRPVQHLLAPRLSRHLRDRPPQPGAPDPLRDPERTRRRGGRARLRAVARHGPRRCGPRGVPLFSVDTHRAGRRLRRARLQPLRRARLHERARLPRPRRRARCGPRTAAPERPDRDRRRPLRVQPRAAGRLRRRLRDRRRRGGGRRDRRGGRRVEAPRAHRAARRVLRELATIPGVYVPVDVRRRVRRPVHRRGARRASPTCPSASTSAPSPTSPTGRTRSTSSCRSSRWCTTGSTSRSSAAARAAAASARPG